MARQIQTIQEEAQAFVQTVYSKGFTLLDLMIAQYEHEERQRKALAAKQ